MNRISTFTAVASLAIAAGIVASAAPASAGQYHFQPQPQYGQVYAQGQSDYCPHPRHHRHAMQPQFYGQYDAPPPPAYFTQYAPPPPPQFYTQYAPPPPPPAYNPQYTSQQIYTYSPPDTPYLHILNY